MYITEIETEKTIGCLTWNWYTKLATTKSQQRSVGVLELYATKRACTDLRGERSREGPDLPDYQARWQVVQMHAQGWNKKSIAGLLKLSHQHVGRIIEAFEQDGFAGLEDKRSRPANHPHNQLSLALRHKLG
jgi:hypothetical protein